MLAIFWKICLMIFFCIFSISSLSAIFIMILHLLQSDDNFSLKHYFLIDSSSLIMFVYDMIFNEKCIFLCICNCSLNSWTCYDSSYASSLIVMLMIMLMTMLMTILRAIVDCLSLKHRLVLKSTLFRISLCSSESYR